MGNCNIDLKSKLKDDFSAKLQVSTYWAKIYGSPKWNLIHVLKIFSNIKKMIF